MAITEAAHRRRAQPSWSAERHRDTGAGRHPHNAPTPDRDATDRSESLQAVNALPAELNACDSLSTAACATLERMLCPPQGSRQMPFWRY